jgi:hypothetical protein
MLARIESISPATGRSGDWPQTRQFERPTRAFQSARYMERLIGRVH